MQKGKMMDELSRWYESLTYEEAKNILREKLDNMKKSFIAAGYYMKYIRDHELFQKDGYESIWEFAEDNYGIKKSTASRWMSMNDKFSQGGNSPILAEEYRGFEKSQLQEMLYLDDKQMETVTPDMTVKEIREVRKPVEPEIELKKPDKTDREYLNAAAEHLIKSLWDWFLQDHMNRVQLVDRSPEEIKKKLGKDHRSRWFSTETGVAHINLFDDYVQVWNEKGECIGDFEWFYLAASIQSMWNHVSLEKAQEEQTSREKEKLSPIDRGCITGENPNGNCTCCGKDGVKCCGQCDDDCNSRCGWIDAAVATSQRDEVEPAPDMNPPEVIAEENVEVVDADEDKPSEELYEETSYKSDIDILQEELGKAKNNLNLMLSCYTEKDIRVRKQKLIIGALEGMISDLDTVDIPEPEQPELPVLRNNNQRKEFLDNYQSWPVWFKVDEASEVYYRYELPDGCSIVICEYHYYLTWMEKYADENPNRIGKREYLLRPGYYYLEDCKTNTSALVEHLRKIQKGGK